jgi:hypothetical protein
VSGEQGTTRGEFVRRSAASGFAVAGALGSGWAGRALAAVTEPPNVHTFVTRPDLRPPVLTVLERRNGVSAGHLFMAPSSGPGQRGPLIVDDTGQPIWSYNSRPLVAMNFRPGIYQGKPVLSWWEGRTTNGLGHGTHVILDDTYREIARVSAGAGRPADLHEFILTGRNTALVTSWERVSMDLSSLGGPSNGIVVGGIVQEIELPSGRVLFDWHSLDHVDISESYAGVSTRAAYDYFHVNSIELDHDGNLIVSARHTWTVYKIDRGSGEIIWRLGGKKSDFAMGPGTVFAWQHDARRHGGSEYLISVFDDGAAAIRSQPYSKAMILALDLRRMQATLHRKYVHVPDLSAHALGSVQVFPGSNVLVGWGTSPYVTEYTSKGEVVFDAHLPHGGENYRTLRLPWVGRPAEPPMLVYRHTGGQRVVYASWNGATEVTHWQLETRTLAGAFAVASTLPRSGFETQLPVPYGAKDAVVAGLDRHGTELGRSNVIRV